MEEFRHNGISLILTLFLCGNMAGDPAAHDPRPAHTRAWQSSENFGSERQGHYNQT